MSIFDKIKNVAYVNGWKQFLHIGKKRKVTALL